jgi:hypothetical protein
MCYKVTREATGFLTIISQEICSMFKMRKLVLKQNKQSVLKQNLIRMFQITFKTLTFYQFDPKFIWHSR